MWNTLVLEPLTFPHFTVMAIASTLGFLLARLILQAAAAVSKFIFKKKQTPWYSELFSSPAAAIGSALTALLVDPQSGGRVSLPRFLALAGGIALVSSMATSALSRSGPLVLEALSKLPNPDAETTDTSEPPAPTKTSRRRSTPRVKIVEPSSSSSSEPTNGTQTELGTFTP